MNRVASKQPGMLPESHTLLQSMLQDLYHSFRHDADGVVAVNCFSISFYMLEIC